MIGDVDRRSAVEDRETIRKFEKVLRQQYVIETCDAGSSHRHVWNFHDWFTQRCSMLARFVEVCFRLGMVFLLSSIMTFEFAHLERGDADASVQSTSAWQGFCCTLGCLIVIGVTVPQIVGSSWSWRFRMDGFKGCRNGPRGCATSSKVQQTSWFWWICRCVSQCFGQVTAPHKPVRFDIHHIAAQAEELFNQIDEDGNGLLSASELKAAAKVAREKADRTRAEADAAAMLVRRTPEMRRRASCPNGSAHGHGVMDLNGVMPENSLPQSPHEGEVKRRNKEEEAAATAVLETIIRRLAERAEKRRHVRIGDPERRTSPPRGTRTAGGAGAPASDEPREGLGGKIPKRSLSKALGATRRMSATMSKPIAAVTARRELEVTKEEWDEAISDALF